MEVWVETTPCFIPIRIITNVTSCVEVWVETDKGKIPGISGYVTSCVEVWVET